MKKRVVSLLAVLCAVAFLAWGQDMPSGTVAAFKKGNSQELSKYLGDKVSLVIQAETVDAGKGKAARVMEDFFARHKVQGFEVNHKDQRAESGFIIGTLKTKEGDFRVHCFFKKAEKEYVIHQIRIDRINNE